MVLLLFLLILIIKQPKKAAVSFTLRGVLYTSIALILSSYLLFVSIFLPLNLRVLALFCYVTNNYFPLEF